jgi:acetyl-CoA carboxylase biotin carboxyl carrier protein
MSDRNDTPVGPDRELIESVWAEARDLVKRLEGSTVQRFAVAAGEYRIEIERGAPPPLAPGPPPPPARTLSGPIATGALPGPGVSPGARMMSGAFAAIGAETDNRIPVLAPLVGTFYRAARPGSKAFADVGDTVEAGQTVCIVEAMKLMNEVAANEGGTVAEILVENGDWVEFEQVLMYLEPPEEPS